MKIISYCIWGHKALYWKCLPYVIKANAAIYPGWQVVVYTDTESPSWQRPLLTALQERGLVRVTNAGPYSAIGMAALWRLRAIWDFQGSVVLSRDIDSLPTMSERLCVEEWLATNLAVHGINDAPVHTIPLMTGMIGFRPNKFIELTGWKSWEGMVASSGARSAWDVHGEDQALLTNHVWPLVKSSSMLHQLKCKYESGATSVKHEVPRSIETPDVLHDVREGADEVTRHIGYAGFDTARANKFYTEHGNPLVNQRVDEAMKSIDTRPPKRWAVFSIDSNKYYAYYAPLTALLWRRIGYSPLVLAVGRREEWLKDPALNFCLQQLDKNGAKVHFVEPIEGFKTSTVAQVSRLYCGGLPGFWSEDFILTTDCDMWPLNKDFFHKGRPRIGPTNEYIALFHIWFANAYKKLPDLDIPYYPICYLGAEYRTWQQVMNVTQDRLQSRLSEDLHESLGKDPDGWAAWNHDERFFGIRFNQWLTADHERRKSIEYMERFPVGAPVADRIDRVLWHKGDKVSVVGKMDAHMPRNDILAKTYSLIEALDPAFLQGTIQYSEEFFKLAGMKKDA